MFLTPGISTRTTSTTQFILECEVVNLLVERHDVFLYRNYNEVVTADHAVLYDNVIIF